MKKKILGLSLILCVMLCGCGSIATQDTSGRQNTANKKSTDNAVKKEIYYGEWEIVSSTGSGYIFSTTYKEEDYTGIKILISEDSFRVSGGQESVKIENPKYKKHMVTNDELYSERKISKKNLGYADSEQVVAVDVLDGKKEVDAFGTSFYIKDDTHLIFIGPMYFMAKKVK